jgi:hypothetical protein
MAAIAREVARTFGRFEPLEASRLDILGSVGGIVAFLSAVADQAGWNAKVTLAALWTRTGATRPCGRARRSVAGRDR